VPIPVSDATAATFKSIEGNVDRFIKLQLSEYLTPARHRMAEFVGAGPNEVVFVPNASHGLNTVLRNLIWNKEDIIITGRRRSPVREYPPPTSHLACSNYDL
jgi:selenocysteine lyase/cysteine desulfurase